MGIKLNEFEISFQQGNSEEAMLFERKKKYNILTKFLTTVYNCHFMCSKSIVFPVKLAAVSGLLKRSILECHIV